MANNTLLAMLMQSGPGDGVDKSISGKEIDRSPESYDKTIADLVSYSVGAGEDPIKTVPGRVLLKSKYTPEDKSLFDAITIFNQRADVKGKTPEERVRLFYEMKSDNPGVEKIKSRIKRFGTGPVGFMGTRTDLEKEDMAKVAALNMVK